MEFVTKWKQNFLKHKSAFQDTIEKYSKLNDDSNELDWSELEDELDDDGGDDDEDDDENNIEQSILGENADFFEKNQLNDPETNVQNIFNQICSNTKNYILTSTPVSNENLQKMKSRNEKCPVLESISPFPAEKKNQKKTPLNYENFKSNKPEGERKPTNILNLVRQRNMFNNFKASKQKKKEDSTEIEVVVINSSEDEDEENTPLSILIQKKSQSKIQNNVNSLQSDPKFLSNKMIHLQKENINETNQAILNISQLNPNAESTPKRLSAAQINETNWPQDKTQLSLTNITNIDETIGKNIPTRKTIIPNTQVILETQINIIPETQTQSSNETIRNNELKRSNHDRAKISNNESNIDFSPSNILKASNKKQKIPNTESTPKQVLFAKINETNWPQDKTQFSLTNITNIDETIDNLPSQIKKIRTTKTITPNTQVILETQINIIPETQTQSSNETIRNNELKRSNHDRAKISNNESNIDFSPSNILKASNKKQKILGDEDDLPLISLIQKDLESIKKTLERPVSSSEFDQIFISGKTQSSNETTRSKELKRSNHDRSKNNNESINSNESLIIQKNKKCKYNSRIDENEIIEISPPRNNLTRTQTVYDTILTRTASPKKIEPSNSSKLNFSSVSQIKIPTTKVINESISHNNTPKSTQVVNETKICSQKKTFIRNSFDNENSVTMINESRITSTPISRKSILSEIRHSQFQPKEINSQKSNEISMISSPKSTRQANWACQAGLTPRSSSMHAANETNYSSKKKSFQKIYVDETNEDIENTKCQSVRMISSPSFPKTQIVNETKHSVLTISETPKGKCILEATSQSKNRSINSNGNLHCYVNDLFSSDELPTQDKKETQKNKTFNSFLNKYSDTLIGSPLCQKTQIVNETKNPVPSQSQLVLTPNKKLFVNKATLSNEIYQSKDQRLKGKENSFILKEKHHSHVNKKMNELFSSDESLLNNSDETTFIKTKQMFEHKNNKNILKNSNTVNIGSEKSSPKKNCLRSNERKKQIELNTEISKKIESKNDPKENENKPQYSVSDLKASNKKKNKDPKRSALNSSLFSSDEIEIESTVKSKEVQEQTRNSTVAENLPKEDKNTSQYSVKDLKASNKNKKIDPKGSDTVTLNSYLSGSDEIEILYAAKSKGVIEKTQNFMATKNLPKEDLLSNRNSLEEFSPSGKDESNKNKKTQTKNTLFSDELFKKPNLPSTTSLKTNQVSAKAGEAKAIDSPSKQKGLFFNGQFFPIQQKTSTNESKIRVRVTNSSNKTANLTNNKSSDQSVNTSSSSSTSSSTSMAKTDRFDLKKFLENSFKK